MDWLIAAQMWADRIKGVCELALSAQEWLTYPDADARFSAGFGELELMETDLTSALTLLSIGADDWQRASFKPPEINAEITSINDAFQAVLSEALDAVGTTQSIALFADGAGEVCKRVPAVDAMIRAAAGIAGVSPGPAPMPGTVPSPEASAKAQAEEKKAGMGWKIAKGTLATAAALGVFLAGAWGLAVVTRPEDSKKKRRA